MQVTDIVAELDDIRPDDEEAENSLEILMVKLGQMATGRLKLQSDAAEEKLDQEDRDEARRDLVAGLAVAAFEYAAEHDIDMEKALEERIEGMRDAAEKQAEVKEAMESGDAEALAEALGVDAQAVPTGDGDDEGDADTRGFY